MGAPPASPAPLPLFQQAEQWFQCAHAALLETLPCSRGCSHCCIGPFPITCLDALELQHGLQTLPEPKRLRIVATARRQVELLETAYPALRSTPSLDKWRDEAIDIMVERFSDLPCPALSTDGSCCIYRFRPFTCRTMGIPTEAGGTVAGACTVQTAVPILRLSAALRQEERLLSTEESVCLSILTQTQRTSGEEILLPYGFLVSLDTTP